MKCLFLSGLRRVSENTHSIYDMTWWFSGKESTCHAGAVGREGPLEKEMATHSSIHTWEISWTEEPQSGPWGHRKVGHD